MDKRDTQFCEPLVDHKELHVWNLWVGPFERCNHQSGDLFLVVKDNKLNFVLWTLPGFLSVFFILSHRRSTVSSSSSNHVYLQSQHRFLYLVS